MTSVSAHSNGEIYDLFYAERSSDIDFYKKKARMTGDPILEIGCGTGRLTIPIFKEKLQITGLDLSPSMLKRARQKEPSIEWIEDNAITFDLKQKFKAIIVPFRTLQLVTDFHSLQSTLKNVKKHLCDDGYFILDVFNPDNARLSKPMDFRQRDTVFNHPETGEEITVDYTQNYDPATQITNVVFYYSKSGEKDFFQNTLQLRCYFPQEMDFILHSSGFEIQDKFGDFDESPFKSNSFEQIFICRHKN